MPRFARLAFCSLALLLALFVFTSPGCDTGPARECDERFECGPGLVCDLGSNQCVTPNQSACTAAGVSCEGDTPLCYAETATCVACLEQGAHDECPGNRICEQRTCVACTEDRACIGNTASTETICLSNGGCADEDEVAYVATDGTDNTACTFASPCTSLTKALATTKKYLRVYGNFTLTGPLTIDRTVIIYGASDASTTITRSTAGPIFAISGTGTVELNGLALTGATGANGDGIAISGTPKVSLYRVDLLNNAGVGVRNGEASLTVTSSLIVGNTGGGIASGSGAVRLENNFFVDNGAPTANGGAINLGSNAAANVIRYNTFANNVGSPRAVSCGGTAVRLSSNIFAGPAPQVSNCTTAYSLFSAQPGALGSNDLVGDPLFGPTTFTSRSRDTMNYYRIQPGSPAIGKGEDVDNNQDFYGDSRLPPPRDIGAAEFIE